MATGFQGFLQGFAEGGASIINTQDKATQAAALFEAEHQRQKQIDAEWEAKKQANTVAQQQAAVAGPQTDTNSTSAPVTPPTSPATGSGVTPIDPTSGTVTPADPVSTSPQAPAAPTGTPAPQTPTNPGGAASLDANGNPVSNAPTSSGTPKAFVPDTQLALYGAGDTPTAGFKPTLQGAPTTPTATASTAPITPAERAAVLADLTMKHGKDITPSTDQLNAMAMEKRTKDNQDNAKLKGEQTEKGLDANGNDITNPAPDPALAKQLGVPVADPKLSYSAYLKPDDASKEKRSDQTMLNKVTPQVISTSNKLVDIADQFNKLSSETSTGGAQNALLGIRKNVNSQIQQMNSLTKDEAVGNKTPGFPLRALGEVNLLLDAAQNTKLTPEAAQAIGAKIKAEATEMKQGAMFMKNYFAVNHHLNGAEDAYEEYRSANPVIANGVPVTNRATPAQYFGGTAPAAAASPTSMNAYTQTKAAISPILQKTLGAQ